ncbi:stage V sporulation protein AA [Bacillus coahuilensis m2-6]|uniref:stage V sporulation protein AA n=1 Tax=Bacillus coahuilensis TaxID=408580 RepID=UPI000750156F|nr:stage V sporulation protein AA [Bacillus coahuilensis]KUP07833.1 stage V sporulation protein AA [Bacillus coahuilensis m2-6]
MQQSVYIRLRHKVQAYPNSQLLLKDIAQIIAPLSVQEALAHLLIHEVKPNDQTIIIVDVMKVIKRVQEIFTVDVQIVGASQVIIEVVYHKKKVSIPFFLLVWSLLFVGAALAIMNFHEDVSMQQVHQKLYKVLTGNEIDKPLLFQIPYSIGLGAGMILFFNHLFKKRINEEPSPLEVEMFNYQLDLDNYVSMNENKESRKNLHDHSSH